jgi:2-octaprenyl-6-methoxyphenol hydroxylase
MTGAANYDVLIVGGGLVGASLAVALGRQNCRVALIEAHSFGSVSQPSYDDRSIALAYGSMRIFESMGLWAAIGQSATPIARIHISNRGHFGITRLSAEDAGTSALGYVAESRLMGQALMAALDGLPSIELFAPARLERLDVLSQHVVARVTGEMGTNEISAPLLVAADGQDSTVRQVLGITAARADYDQAAVIANVTPEYSHGNVAYERFTDSGPLALLPLSENRCSLVWTVAPQAVDGLLGCPDDVFLTRLGERFGRRLGKFVKVGVRSSYRLALTRALAQVGPRVALIGNAAHTLHPVAGQGFNLGIRDVAALSHLLIDARSQGRDVGDEDLLKAYAAWRRADHATVIRFTDVLARVFANRFGPVVAARNVGLLLVDCLPPLKRALLKQTMGLAGTLPNLARGLAR